MDTRMDRRFAGRVMRDRRQMERMLLSAARPMVRRLQAATPVRTRDRNRNPPPGTTKRSTRIETGHMNAKRDRVAVRIVQDGASVPLNWRLRRNYMTQAMGR